MRAVRVSEVLLVLNVVWTFTRGDTDVSCQLNNSCILPCSFTYADEVLIHWYQKTPADRSVHSYYYGKDQLGQQDQRFRTRTSLFEDQISRGNASLLLRGVMVQDQGRYQCYTSTVTGNKETFINLKVNAPVQRVTVEQELNQISCSSEGIYPEPGLTWTTSPPSSLTLQNPPTVQQTEQQLYSISSSLRLPDNDTDLDYTCTVSTAASSWRSTWMKPAVINASGTESTIPCWTSSTPLTYLTWRFNHSEVILTKSGDEDYTPSERWRQHVETVSETGRLTLKDLSSDQTGTYTCELSNDKETYIKSTFLHMTGGAGLTAGVVAGVVVAVLLAVAVGAFIGYKKKICKKLRNITNRNHQSIGKEAKNGEENQPGRRTPPEGAEDEEKRHCLPPSSN